MALSNEDVSRLGSAAATLKNSVEFQAVVGSVQAEAFREWHNSAPEEISKRENNYHLMSATKKFSESLDIMIQNGKLAEHKLEEAKAEAFRQRNQPQEGE